MLLKPQNLRFWFIGGGALVILVGGWFFIFSDIAREHDRIIAAAVERSEARAAIFREFADAAFSSAALALRQLDLRPDTPGVVLPADRGLVREILGRTMKLMPLLSGLAVVDREGKVSVAAQDVDGPPANLADRDYFKWHQDNLSSDLLVSRPLQMRFDNRRAIPISMRIEDENGHFAGVIVGGLKADYFRSFLRSLNVDIALLALADGSVIASGPPSPSRADPFQEIDAALVRRWRETGSGNYAEDSPIGDRLQAGSYASLTSIPGAVFIGIDLARELEPWRVEAQHRIIGGFIYTALIVLLAWLAISGMMRDRKTAAALRAAGDEAYEARRRAEEADRNKSVFLAHTSHELRTPLNAIIGFSEILAKEVFGPLDKRYREYSYDIHHSGQHLLAVVNNILDLARVDAGRWDLTRERFTLIEMLDEVGRFVAPEAAARSVELKCDVPPTVPALQTDRRVVKQIILNLVANGIKFTPAGGVVAIVVTQQPDGGLILTVLDTGIGIAAADLEKILEPFSNVANLVARKQGGTGLGLPLCRAFAELLGGELTITSEPGEGTSVSVKLPRECIAIGPPEDADATAA